MSGNNCVLVLVDESSAMSAVMRDKLADGTESTKTNVARVATSINNLLRQLSDGPACDVAVVGYRSNGEGQVDVGFTYGLDENTQLDFGCNFGVTKSAPDFSPFIGISLRY